MNKKLVLSITLLTLLSLILVAPAHAEIKASGDFDKIIKSDGTALFEITLTANESASFNITRSGSVDWDIDISEKSLTVLKGDKKTINITVTPPEHVEVKTYQFTFYMQDEGKDIGNFTIKVSISEDVNPILLENATIEDTAHAGKPLPFLFTLKNNDFNPEKNVKISVDSDIFKEPFVTVKSFIGKELKTISGEAVVKPYLDAGKYELNIRVADGTSYTIYTQQIEIPEEGSLVSATDSKYYFLRSKHTVTITNLANYPLHDEYSLEISGLSRIFTYISPEPDRVESTPSGKSYIFNVDLDSGESMTITYTVSYVPLILAVLALTALLFWYYSRKKCSVVKRVSKSGKEIKVSLIVKNKSRRTLNSLRLVDKVPASLKLIRGVGGGNAPDIIVKHKSHTLITWKIAKLAPKEERVFSYKIKPIIKIVGTINLTPAKLSFGGDACLSNLAAIKSR